MDDQTTTVDRPEEAPAPADRRSVVLTAAAAAAGLGVVVDGVGRSGFSPVFNPAAAPGWQGVRPSLFVAGAMIIGLLALRWWPWLLLAGAVLALVLVVPLLPAAAPLQSLYQDPTLTYLTLAGFPLAVIAVLAAAQELLDGGARGLGAALAGAIAGAGVLGTALVGTGWLRTTSAVVTWRLLLGLLGVAGGVLALLRRRLGADALAGGLRPGARPTVLGALAALLVFVPVVLTEERISVLLGVSQGSLARRGYVVSIIFGLAILGCATLLAAACGAWAAAGAAAAALVQVGVMAPVALGVLAVVTHPGYGIAASLAGVVVGGVAAASRWRVPLAVASGIGAALVVLVAVAATGGEPEKVVQQARWVPAGLLLGMLAAATTTIVAVGATVAANRDGLPAVFGPIVGALVTGGAQAIALLQLRDGEPTASYLGGFPRMGTSAGVLLAAALTVIGIGVAQTVRTRSRAAPAST